MARWQRGLRIGADGKLQGLQELDEHRFLFHYQLVVACHFEKPRCVGSMQNSCNYSCGITGGGRARLVEQSPGETTDVD
jgi:hypothetical protein